MAGERLLCANLWLLGDCERLTADLHAVCHALSELSYCRRVPSPSFVCSGLFVGWACTWEGGARGAPATAAQARFRLDFLGLAVCFADVGMQQGRSEIAQHTSALL